MNDFDDIISGAVTGRADAAPTDVPDFDTVLAVRQDRLRRRTALAAGGLVVAGLAGIGLFATAGDEPPGVAGEPSSTQPRFESPPTTAYEWAEGGIWFCTGRVDRPFFDVPETTVLDAAPQDVPETDGTASTTTIPPNEQPDDATVTTLAPEEDFGHFRHCELVDQAGYPMMTTTTIIAEDAAIVETTAPPATTAEFGSEDARIAEEAQVEEARAAAEETARRVASEAEARRLAEEGIATHIVEDGDHAILIADRYCVGLADLVKFNGWASANELGFPGSLVMIPPTVENCSVPTTTGG